MASYSGVYLDTLLCMQDTSKARINLEVGVPKSVFFPCFSIGRAKGGKSQRRVSDCEATLDGACPKHHYLRQRVWRPVLDLSEERPEGSEVSEMASTNKLAKQNTGYCSTSGTAWDLPDTFWTDPSYSNLRSP